MSRKIVSTNDAMAKLVMAGLACGVDVVGEIEKTVKKYKPRHPEVKTQADLDRIEAAKLKRERRNAKRLKIKN